MRVNQKLVGILLILLLVSVYAYNSESIQDGKLVVIKGILKELPYYGTMGGDFVYKYVKVTLSENKGEFLLQDCSYKLMDYSKMEKLAVGDSLELEIFKVDAMDAKYKVVSLSSSSCGIILNREQTKNCYRERWKIVFYLAAAVFCVLLYQIIPFKRIWKTRDE